MSTSQKIIHIEEYVKYNFLRSIVREVEEENRKGIHVTDVCYDCLRRAYYQVKIRNEGGDSSLGYHENDFANMWIGKKLHETDVSDLHELDLEWNGIIGRIDEVFLLDGDVVIVDKKTTRKTPNKPYDHHVKQVAYYGVLLKNSGGVSGKNWYGCVLYIDVDSGVATPYAFEFKPEDYEAELMMKVSILKDALEKGKPPKPKCSWICNYCSFVGRCVKE